MFSFTLISENFCVFFLAITNLRKYMFVSKNCFFGWSFFSEYYLPSPLFFTYKGLETPL